MNHLSRFCVLLRNWILLVLSTYCMMRIELLLWSAKRNTSVINCCTESQENKIWLLYYFISFHFTFSLWFNDWWLRPLTEDILLFTNAKSSLLCSNVLLYPFYWLFQHSQWLQSLNRSLWNMMKTVTTLSITFCCRIKNYEDEYFLFIF